LLPITVICELIGIPEADREGFRPVARDLAGVFEINDLEMLPAINATAVELLAYFTELAARRRADPRDDLLSDLLAVSGSGDGRLTDAELLHNLTLLLVAAFETTTNLLGNGLQVILQDQSAGQAVTAGSVPAPPGSTRCARTPRPSASAAARISASALPVPEDRGCGRGRAHAPGHVRPARLSMRSR
jgi:hypothetical protein